MDKISEHISYAEATVSAKASELKLKNDPPADLIPIIKYTAEKLFEPIRKHFGGPIQVLSFYRTEKVNAAVGGATSSQHVKGEAIDMSGTKYGTSNAEIFEYILVNLKFDQLIWEFGNDDEPEWVDESIKKSGNRGEVLRAKKVNGKTKYIRL